MAERWRDIPEWDERYQVSDQGRVRSKNCVITRSNGVKFPIRSAILKQTIDEHGKASVRLHKKGTGETYRVHKLVLLAFAGPPEPGLVACHGPKGVSDNRLLNLSYDTRRNNNLDMYRDGTMRSAKCVQRSDGHVYPSLHRAAEENNVHVMSICNALKGKSKTCDGFTWSYV